MTVSFKANFGKKLKFPVNITITSLHPDMGLTSESTKQVVVDCSLGGPN